MADNNEQREMEYPETLTERIKLRRQQERRNRQNSVGDGGSNDNLPAPRMPLARRNGRRANGQNIRAPAQPENVPAHPALPLPDANPMLLALDIQIPLIPEQVEEDPAPPRPQDNAPLQAEDRAFQDQLLVEEIENIQPLEEAFEMNYGNDEQERLEVVEEENEGDALRDQALRFLQVPRVPEPQVEWMENVQPVLEMDHGEEEQEMLEVIDEGNEEENENDVEGEEDEGEHDEPAQEPAQDDEENEEEAQQRPAAPRLALTKLEMRRELRNGNRLENRFPERVISNVLRIDLVENGNGEVRQILASKKCSICNETGGEKIGRCEGMIGKKIKCSNRCHLVCAEEYNASGITMQYAAEQFNQNKFLCPLHVCAACDGDCMKKDAYAGEMVACKLCLKAYHPECLPAGARLISVVVKAGKEEEVVKMMECPDHTPTGDYQGEHLEVCEGCHESRQLQKCSKCPRAFHPRCRSVRIVDGKRVSHDLCSHCASKSTIRIGSMVLHYHRKRVTTAHFVRNSETIGKAWIRTNNGEEVERRVNELVGMEEHYLELAPARERKNWAAMWKAACDDKKKEILELKSNVEYKLSKSMSKAIGPSRSESESSESSQRKKKKELKSEEKFCEVYITQNTECPPNCSEKKACKNRPISQCYVHRDMKLADCGAKGQGVLATALIPDGQFLGEYIGEPITKDVMEEREENIKKSGDKQFCHYFMENGDIYIDAANYGNITRFFNHSCEPNAESKKMKKNTGGKTEDRIVIVAVRDIREGEEITINYGWESMKTDCFCGAKKCLSKKSS